MISYAQNFEDVMLWRALKHIERGFYIDIGAQDPIVDSVSLAFYENGWRGVHVEPTPAYAQALRDARPDETVVQAAIGDESELIAFFEVPNTGISTGDAVIAHRHTAAGFATKPIDVPCIRLSTLLDRYQDREIHWMKVDVEGMELSVLRSWAPSSLRPWIVVLESTLPLSQEQSHGEWEQLILKLGYSFAYFDGLNRFYLSEQHQELLHAFSAPPNVFDNFLMSGSGSNTFCTRLNSALTQAHAEHDSLTLRQRELEAQLGLAEQGLARRESEVEQAAHDALAQARLIGAALQQLEDGRQETLQLLRRLDSKEDAHAAQLLALLGTLSQREELLNQAQLQIAVAHADVVRLQAELIRQQEAASASALANEQATTSRLLAASEAAQAALIRQQEAASASALANEQVTTSRLLAASEVASLQLAAVSKQHAATLEAANTMHREQRQELALATDALEKQLRKEVERSRAESEALQERVRILRAELECAHRSLFSRLSVAFRRFRSSAINRRTALTHTANDITNTTTTSGERLHEGGTPTANSNATVSSEGETQTYPTTKPNMNLVTPVNRPASSVNELLALQDEEFVRCAYFTLLGRPPDPSGLEHYLGRVRRGASKGLIVAGIARSPEGRARATKLPGLREIMWQHRRRLPSVMGRLLRRALTSAIEPLAIQVRGTENLIFRLHQDSAARLGRLEASTSELRALLVQSMQIPQRVAVSRPAISQTPAAPIATPTRRIYYYVDHTVACPTNTGMQRVARRLGDALLNTGESVTFVKWDAAARSLVLLHTDDLRHLSNWNGPKLTDADLVDYPDASKAAVSISPSNGSQPGWLLVPEVPHITYQDHPMTLDVLEAGKKLGLKTCFVFYDATPLRRPELQPMSVAHSTYMQQLLLADLVVPISNWVSGDLSGFLRFDQSANVGPTPKIQPIQLPGESQLAPRVKIPHDPTRTSPFILSVGSIVPHKNQMSLVSAFDSFCQSNPATPWTLRLAGNLHGDIHTELHAVMSKNPRVMYLGEVDDDALVRLYKDCAFTVFPSVMEGFGLPILESLWFSKPCVCANFGAMAEVAEGGGCLTVDTHRVDELQGAIATLINSPERLALLEREARERNIDSWHHYATKLTHAMTDLSSPASLLGDIFYWVDHTAKYDGNTGIQRVVRALARSLLEQGARLIAVCWSVERQTAIPATPAELEHLEKWNGPRASDWTKWKPIEQAAPRDWLLVPELTHLQTGAIKQFAQRANIRCAWVFYDTIPWKMPEIYPLAATTAHRDYMTELRDVEKVLAISNFSRDDLLTYLTSIDARCGEVHRRISACVLPGEFLESERVRIPRSRRTNGPVRILSVGTVEPRKNHLVLLQAMKLVQQNTTVPIELVLAGGDSFPDLADKVQDLVDSLPGAKWIRRIGDAGLHKLYRDCDFTVYPSIEEGFGLPILESLWNARPCVCANFGAMNEVAPGGGCMTVDTRDASMLANVICQLVEDRELLEDLGHEATQRSFKTWRDYGREVLTQLADERMSVHELGTAQPFETSKELATAMPNLASRPLLSICISTYNRAAWLSVNLKNLQRLWPDSSADVELLVCDNASTDATPAAVQPYLHRSDFTYIRNSENVGMLGNLRVTAHHARGRYVWILGDDDLVMPGTIQRVLKVLRSNSETALVYMNYAYTRIDKAEEVGNIDQFLRESTPIGSTGPDKVGTVRDMCVMSENFFTAIYCLIFRRDHALRAYSQDTSGRPFSTMLTCIPTTYHVLNYMMDEPAYWMGEPQLVVNMNVSWMRYAPLWILERLPEAFDVAERYGGDRAKIDRWRINLVPHVQHWFNDIVSSDPEGNAEYVSIQRLVNRFKHLDEFKAITGSLRQTYQRAHEAGHPLAVSPAEVVFSAFP